MKKDQKNKRVLQIADELEILGYPEVADKLREGVTSGKPNSNEQSETNEEEPPPTGGGNPPDDKSKPDKPN